MCPTPGELVELYVYDLSGGLARILSPMLLNEQIEGVWHTSVSVGGVEYYFGHGINAARPGCTPFGLPVQVLTLGHTQIPADVREALLDDLRQRYTPLAYDLFSNNCNTFSDEFAQILVGQGIPHHITGLPARVLATPFGRMLRPALAGVEARLREVAQIEALSASASASALPLTPSGAASPALGRAPSSTGRLETAGSGTPLSAGRTPGASASPAGPLTRTPGSTGSGSLLPSRAASFVRCEEGHLVPLASRAPSCPRPDEEAGAPAPEEAPGAGARCEAPSVLEAERALEAAVARVMMADAGEESDAEQAARGARADGVRAGQTSAPTLQAASAARDSSTAALVASPPSPSLSPPASARREAERGVQDQFARIRCARPELDETRAAALALEREAARLARLEAALGRERAGDEG